MRDFIVKIALKLGLYKFLVKIDTYFINKKLCRNFKNMGLKHLFIWMKSAVIWV